MEISFPESNLKSFELVSSVESVDETVLKSV